MKKRLKYIYESIRDFIIKIFTSRTAIIGIVFCVFFVIILSRLFYLQIIKADYYKENFTLMAQKTIYSEGARGNIYDKDGNILAHNEVSYSVVMTDEIKSSDQKGEIINKIIFDTINIIESNGDRITDDFNIAFKDGKAVFKDDPVTPAITFLCNVFGLKSTEIRENGYDRYTAEQVLDYMCSDKRFDIDPEIYNLEDRIKICTVRYALSLNSYQKYISTEIASDINQYTQAAIMENRAELTGIDVKETYKRIYDYGVYYGSILGYTGYISENELGSYNSNDLGIEYQAGDIVGKTGVEASFDSYLKGTRGTETVFVDSKGSIMQVVDTTRSVSGNDLYLTLDTDLQIAFYEILEREVAGLLVSSIVNWDYVSDGTDEIVYIPVNDVYYKLLTNVCDPLEFSNPGATFREKNIYSAFMNKLKTVVQEIEKQLNDFNAPATGELTEEFNEYMYTSYNVLGDEGILNKDIMDTSDPVYIQFANEQISLREFLIHAISKNWINVSLLDSTEKYAASDELYDCLVKKLLDKIVDNTKFQENVYYFMIYNGDISPYDICMLMYDQNRLPEDDPMKANLEQGLVSPYEYVISQITDLVITPAMVALDPCSASFVLTDSATGKVKALVSYPSYDNNMLSGKIDADYWHRLNTDASAPLYNRATQALTAPGSTFKPVTAAAGLNEGVITLDTYIFDDGIFTDITPSPKCWIYPDNHGYENVSMALTDSCNFFFYSVGYKLSLADEKYMSLQGLDILEEYATQMGLNMKSGVEIEESAPKFSNTDSVRTAIGQGTSGFATVQLARYCSCIASRGQNCVLSLIDRVDDKNGKTIFRSEKTVENVVELKPEYWDAIHLGMRGVVTEGSVSGIFADSPVYIAGKTGTTQESIYRPNHSNFIGFSPYNEPEIAFACTIRNGGSSSYAAATTKDCIEYYYGYTSLEDILESGAKDIVLEGVTD
ncbi:MAG: penicillin-binding protein [Parasporobacterium sp.]|nr:penicillin-binding protein [Parasporobacterium sp.]